MGKKRTKQAAKKQVAPPALVVEEVEVPPAAEVAIVPDEADDPGMCLIKKIDNFTERLEDLERRTRLALRIPGDEIRNQPSLFTRPIGFIKSAYPEKTGTPRQGVLCPDVRAELTIEKEIFTNAQHSLDGLSGFSHIWLIFWFHLNEGPAVRAKVKPPRLEGKESKGVFATRSPHRPNPLGLSLVKLDKIVGEKLFITGVDLVDGTPVLDIKPFIRSYDSPAVGSEEKSPASWVSLTDSNLPSLKAVQFTSYALRKLARYHGRCAEECGNCLRYLDETSLYAAMAELLKTDLRSRYRKEKCSDRIQIVSIDNLKVSVWYDDEGNAHVLNLESRDEKREHPGSEKAELESGP
ncbi:uncharacterized protein LOC100899841 isoform X1 [Galendromus occidentalis]|uniref:Uncharacterized protein LOC100899841 isoform X1 n=1 Tax=Galendromus occidentalis TaxID=34638 RepID=A0AAJ6VY61_9ACAR|nr:uncharacterized protein LOC100899841 isoform X1 [Galendromus occidentalis]